MLRRNFISALYTALGPLLPEVTKLRGHQDPPAHLMVDMKAKLRELGSSVTDARKRLLRYNIYLVSGAVGRGGRTLHPAGWLALSLSLMGQSTHRPEKAPEPRPTPAARCAFPPQKKRLAKAMQARKALKDQQQLRQQGEDGSEPLKQVGLSPTLPRPALRDASQPPA